MLKGRGRDTRGVTSPAHPNMRAPGLAPVTPGHPTMRSPGLPSPTPGNQMMHLPGQAPLTPGHASMRSSGLATRPGQAQRALPARPEPDYEVVEFPSDQYVNAKLQPPPPPPPRPPTGKGSLPYSYNSQPLCNSALHKTRLCNHVSRPPGAGVVWPVRWWRRPSALRRMRPTSAMRVLRRHVPPAS